MESARLIIPLSLLLLICSEAIREDIKGGRISNTLCAAGAILGVSAGLATGGTSKLLENSLGLLLGILLLILPFSARMVGGGDVKFLGCIGSILGWRLLLPSFFASAAIGGAIGIILILSSERSPEKIRRRIVLARAGVLKTRQDYSQFLSLRANARKRTLLVGEGWSSNPEFLPYSIPLSAGALLVSSIQLARHLN